VSSPKYHNFAVVVVHILYTQAPHCTRNCYCKARARVCILKLCYASLHLVFVWFLYQVSQHISGFQQM